MTVSSLSMIYAQSEISLWSGKKDYTNSKTKVDGKYIELDLSHKYNNSKISLGYKKDDVDREHPITETSLETLHVKKFNLLYSYNITQNFTLKGTYLKILDNLAPTDQGKVYGLGGLYSLPKGFGTGIELYKSVYRDFDVDQYDLSFSKKFQFGETKGKASLIGKSIHIDGEKYGNYSFQDKDYFTTGVNLGLHYHSYFGGIGTFFGKRIFTVLDKGQKVQHHAMEQDKTYMLSFGKKFSSFDIIAKYSFQNGKELPEKQDDVDQRVITLGLNFKF